MFIQKHIKVSPKIILALGLLLTHCNSSILDNSSATPTTSTANVLRETQAVQDTNIITETSPDLVTLFTQRPIDGQIVFVSNRDGNDEIYVINADGSQQTRLTYNTWPDHAPVWSPDGQQIVFVSYVDENYEIYAMGADGGQPMRLTYNNTFDGQPGWSPDGEFIVFVSDRDSNLEIYVMNADGSQQRRLTNHPAIDSDPAWSPNGRHIVFSSARNSLEDVVFVNSALYIVSVDSGEPIALTDSSSSNTSPVWSPDGEYIAFISDRDSARGRVSKLYLMNVATHEVQRVTDDDMLDYLVPHEFSPAWSPDGQYLAFTLDDGVPHIYIMGIESGMLFQLTNGDAKNHSPHWWAP